MAAELEQKEVPFFESRKNITIGRAMSLFAHGSQIQSVPAEEHPYFILLVGSPGVGKTTQIRRFIEDEKGDFRRFIEDEKEKFRYKYDNFYHISLDVIVEHIKPYREATKSAYNKLMNTRRNANLNVIPNLKGKTINADSLYNQDRHILAKFYSIIQSTSNDFGLTSKKMKNIERNIRDLYFPSVNNKRLSNKTKKQKNNNQAVDLVQLDKKLAGITFNDVKLPPIKNRVYHENAPLLEAKERLFKASEAALYFGIQQRYNIIYDTTLDGTPKRLIEILRLMEHLHQPSHKKYKIFVINVTASTENIKQRIYKRHREMLANEKIPYLRAIKTNMVNEFKNNSEKGINAIQQWLASNNSKKILSVYTSDDIHLIPSNNPNLKINNS